MSLVAVILCVVLGMFCFTRIHAFRAESEIAIRHSVNNTGKAIPEEDLPHLFERFYRTDKSRARTDNGYGLGLAIAQTIAKNHRGKITVVSAKISLLLLRSHFLCQKKKNLPDF